MFLILLLSVASYGQYSVEWAKGFGGNRKDRAKSIIETHDGELIVAGTVMKRKTHLWLLKMDAGGNEKWGRTYEENYSSGANSIIQAQDKSIVVGGFYLQKRRNRNTNGLIMKTDIEGKVIWQKEYGGIGTEIINEIVETNEGGYVAVGFSDTNEDAEKEIWFINVDSKGELLYEAKFVDSEEDVANSVIKTYDGNFVIVGYGNYGSRKEIRLIKVDRKGEVIWDIPYLSDFICEAHEVIELPDKNIIVVGDVRAEKITNFDAQALKISEDGKIIWSKLFGLDKWEEATDVVYTYDEKIVICGFEKSENYLFADFWIRKIDSTGNLIWEDTFKKKSLDFPNSIIESKDNGLIIAGSTFTGSQGWDYAILKYKDANKTDIIFNQPDDSVITSITEEYDISVCVKSYKKPKNVDIIVNGVLQIPNAYNPTLISSKECPYPIFNTLKFQKGTNTVKVVVTDERDYIVSKEREIFYIPPVDLNW